MDCTVKAAVGRMTAKNTLFRTYNNENPANEEFELGNVSNAEDEQKEELML